jgi:hypothetical protein
MTRPSPPPPPPKMLENISYCRIFHIWKKISVMQWGKCKYIQKWREALERGENALVYVNVSTLTNSA